MTFVEFLNQRRVSDEKALVALRFYLAEVTDDRLPDEMRADINAHVRDGARVSDALRRLAVNREVQAAAALAYFATRWEEAGEQERIERAFDAAGTKLPVIEAGIIAIVTMYALFLGTTKGRKSRKHSVRRNADGSFEETTEEEMWGPTGPLQSVVALLKPASKDAV
jgi:hypothetical protein